MVTAPSTSASRVCASFHNSWAASAAASPDGRSGYYLPDDVRSCMGARLMSNLDDRVSELHWHRCAVALHTAQALDGFSWRYWTLIVAGVWTLLAPFGFAFATGFARPPHRVLRGRRLLTGETATRALCQSAKADIKQSGTGLELLPGLAVSRVDSSALSGHRRRYHRINRTSLFDCRRA